MIFSLVIQDAAQAQEKNFQEGMTWLATVCSRRWILGVKLAAVVGPTDKRAGTVVIGGADTLTPLGRSEILRIGELLFTLFKFKHGTGCGKVNWRVEIHIFIS